MARALDLVAGFPDGLGDDTVGTTALVRARLAEGLPEASKAEESRPNDKVKDALAMQEDVKSGVFNSEVTYDAALAGEEDKEEGQGKDTERQPEKKQDADNNNGPATRNDSKPKQGHYDWQDY